MKAVYEIHQSIIDEGLDLDKALDVILRYAIKLTGAESGSISLYDRDTNELVVRAEIGSKAGKKIGRQKPGGGVTGWVAQHRQPALIPDVRRERRYRARVPNMRSELAVPIALEDDLLGVLDVKSSRIAAFHEEHVHLLESLGRQAIIALRYTLGFERSERLQRELIAKNQLAAFGVMALFTTHELGNMLEALSSSVARLREKNVFVEPPVLKSIDLIERTANSLQEMTETILRPLKSLDDPSTEVDINACISEAIQKVKSLRAGRVRIQRKLERNLPRVHANSPLVTRVIYNLLENSLKEMGNEGGLISIVTGQTLNGEIQVVYSDNGPGIPANLRNQLLEGPVKSSHGGNGLGLYLSRLILNRYGGDLQLGSSPKGSTFIIRMPPHVPGRSEL